MYDDVHVGTHISHHYTVQIVENYKISKLNRFIDGQ